MIVNKTEDVVRKKSEKDPHARGARSFKKKLKDLVEAEIGVD